MRVSFGYFRWRLPFSVPHPPPERGQGGRGALADWGFDAAQMKRLESLGLGIRD